MTDIFRPASAGSVAGSISGVKLVELNNSTFAVAFSGTAAPNGTLYNSALAETPVSTGRMYTQIFVRHWDTCRFDLSRRVKLLLTSHGSYTSEKQHLVHYFIDHSQQ
jgi:hypothetical protein